MHLLRKQQRRKPPLFTIYGKLIGTYYIKTPNNRLFRLSERRDDELGVYMYWMIRLTKNGKYEVLRRLDPRYCEVLDELHTLSRDNVRNLVSKIDESKE